ncbi:metal-dependent hydrolase [Candidatus Woesearchaeota archaeon]|nr:metal-dependent hydrolase [Candidatus Woesearchaeota archaeon]
MAHAVTHILLPIIGVDIYRDFFAKRKFGLFFVYLTGVFGILPDIDLPIGLLIGRDIHGTITHSIVWPILAIFVGILFIVINKNTKNKKIKRRNKMIGMLFLFAGIGLAAHVLLDCAFGGYGILANLCPGIFNGYEAWFDAVILLGWLGWEWRKHNIKDFV